MSQAKKAAREGRRTKTGRWIYTTPNGYERQEDIFLYPELDCSSMVDDYYELDGQGQFGEYVCHLAERYPQWIKVDAVPISWTVQPACELAPPFLWRSEESIYSGHFLKHFTWPHDAKTGERLDWFSLPVINDRFPEFAKALAWTPSPLQPFCPLRTIVTARGMKHLLDGL